MELNEVQSTILSPFVDVTIQAMNDMVNMDARVGEGFEDDVEEFRFKGYAVAADMSGSASGKVLMHLYPETAIEVGNRLLSNLTGESYAGVEIDEDIAAALEEWGNTVVGLATRGLEESEIDVTFTPPYFVTNTEDMDEVMKGVNEVMSVPIFTDGAGRFYFNYLLHDKTGEA